MIKFLFIIFLLGPYVFSQNKFEKIRQADSVSGYNILTTWRPPAAVNNTLSFSIPDTVYGKIFVTTFLNREEIKTDTITVLFSGEIFPGYYNIYWDGAGANGIRVGSGIYSIELYCYRKEYGIEKNFTGSARAVILK